MIVSPDPSTLTGRLGQPKQLPCVAVFRVFDHSAIFTHVKQGGLETPLVIAKAFDFALCYVARLALPELAPTLAGRVRNNRVRPHVHARVVVLIERLDAGQIVVAAACLDV